jgi:hypothetical protein
VSLIVRGVYLRRLFHGFRMLPHGIRALAPTVPAAGAVLLARALIDSRSAGMAAAEVVMYLAITVVATVLLERPLLREVAGYLGGRTGGTPAAAARA